MDIPAILTLDPSQLVAGPAGSGSVQGVVSRITCLDARHGAGNWTQRTGVGAGGYTGGGVRGLGLLLSHVQGIWAASWAAKDAL